MSDDGVYVWLVNVVHFIVCTFLLWKPILYGMLRPGNLYLMTGCLDHVLCSIPYYVWFSVLCPLVDILV